MNPRAMSEWTVPAASWARVPSGIGQARTWSSPPVENEINPTKAKQSLRTRWMAGSSRPRSARNACCSSPASWATSISITADTQPTRVRGRARAVGQVLLGHVHAVQDRLLREEGEAADRLVVVRREGDRAQRRLLLQLGLAPQQDPLLADLGLLALPLDGRREPPEPPVPDLEGGHEQLGLEVP